MTPAAAPVTDRARRFLAVGAGGALVGAVGLAVWRARRRGAAPPETGTGVAVRHRSLGARNARLVGVGARASGALAVHRARRVFADAERREHLDREFELRTAEQVADALGQMKGALMKLGQMVSYLDQGLPEHVRLALADLQRDAPPMHPELAADVVEAELGARPEELFDRWDPEPLAAASIGQVHRAVTHEGEAVAVKVQYPGIDEAVGADLRNVDLVFAGLAQLFPGLDHRPLVSELKTRLAEELDYHNEARNQSLFAATYDGHPFIQVPKVVARYSTARVLTTELAVGATWDELLGWSSHERDLAAETLYRFAFGSLYRLGAFNGDPHPGNYLFRPGGRVTFLDFGLVRHFTDDELRPFEELIRAMVLDRDPAAFRRTVEQIGLLRPDEPFSDDLVSEYFGHFYELVLHDGDYTVEPEYASETVRRFFDQRGPYGEIMRAANVPPTFVIIQRINLGLYALFGELRATGNWRRLAEEIWPFVSAPPSTPMGRAIEAWAAARGDGSA
ncbi:MAG: AarF/ABC1/UbiB kinase family protein [Acidimicrobiales bacterium]|nr:AarF/ABC1/UbiB kinase family protein [Acidimicrobiales bacterium]